MKKNIIITCILVIIVVFVIIFISNKDKKANIQILQSEVNYVEDIKNSDEENEKVENITAEQGSTVNTKIYQISTEYDGREVAIVKPSIQFKVAIAGAIKKAKPEFDEIDELLKKAPTHTGIWINSSSRELVRPRSMGFLLLMCHHLLCQCGIGSSYFAFGIMSVNAFTLKCRFGSTH